MGSIGELSDPGSLRARPVEGRTGKFIDSVTKLLGSHDNQEKPRTVNDQQWEQLRAKAQKASDSVYETEVSKIGSLTQQDVDDILKTSATNRSQLNELVSIVRDATKSNQEKAQSVRNVEGLSELAVSLLGKFFK